jgi:hypothetical protein
MPRMPPLPVSMLPEREPVDSSAFVSGFIIFLLLLKAPLLRSRRCGLIRSNEHFSGRYFEYGVKAPDHISEKCDCNDPDRSDLPDNAVQVISAHIPCCAAPGKIVSLHNHCSGNTEQGKPMTRYFKFFTTEKIFLPKNKLIPIIKKKVQIR